MQEHHQHWRLALLYKILFYLYIYISVQAQSRAHIRHEWPGPVGTHIQVGIAWAVHDGYDIIN